MGDIEVYKVYRTTNYDKFVFMDDNRSVERSRVKKITESINSVGYRKVPILVNSNFEIIDGQGRLTALKELGAPVDYIIDETADINVCRHLNQGQSNWKMKNYIYSYAKDGNTNYINFVKLMDLFPDIPLQVIAGTAFGIIVSNGWPLKCLSDGTLILTDEMVGKTLEKLDFIQSILKELSQIKGAPRLVITIASWIYSQDGVDKKRLLNIYKEKYPLIIPCVDVVISLNNLSDLYNKGIKDKSKRMYFDVIYKNENL